MDNKPNYYAIIPASVRYDKKIPPGAKLMYGEMVALAKKEGYCWATNAYFADLYNVSSRSVQSWISSLSKNKHITIHEIMTPQGTLRKIFLLELRGEKKSSGGGEEKPTEGEKKSSTRIIQENNTMKGSQGSPDPQLKEEEREIIPTDDDGNELKPRWTKPREEKKVKETYLSLLNWAAQRRNLKFTDPKKQFKAFSMLEQAEITRGKAMERWIEMENDPYWDENGFDWFNVAQSFNRKA